MKILMISPEFIPSMGGTEIQAGNLARMLRCKGHDVRILTRLSDRSWPLEESLDDLPVQRVDYPRIRLVGGLMLNIMLAWAILVRYRTMDIFHFHIGGSYMILPLLATKLLGKPSLVKISGWWEMDRGFLQPHKTMAALLRRIIFCADRIVAVSQEIRTRLQSLGFPKKRIVAIANGVDTRRFYPSQLPTQQSLVFVGRLVAEKGLFDLLRAVSLLARDFPDLRLSLAGEGDERSKLADFAAELGIIGQVVFLGKRTDVADVLREASIYVQPSLSEGLPNSLLEAMACGIPVVVTRVGGMPDVVEDTVHGLVVEPGQPEELAAALKRLLSDPERAQRMGVAGAMKIEKDFSLGAIADRMLAVYETLLHR